MSRYKLGEINGILLLRRRRFLVCLGRSQEEVNGVEKGKGWRERRRNGGHVER